MVRPLYAHPVSYTHLDTGVITDVTKGESWQAAAFPPFIQNIIEAGGLLKSLKEREA